MDSIIQVKNLVRDFEFVNGVFKKKKKITRAVDKLSFEVNKGEIFGLLGPNGAGKTTTIKILTTLLAPTAGEVYMFGYKPFGQEKEIRPLINFIYGGERNLYWRITARENLMYFSDLYKIDKYTRNKRVPELLELVGLSDRADERVENYSKGMKQRLQIARGLVNDPEVLFLDEPTIGLDPVGARDLRQIIKTLKSRGKTIVLTTHYMFEADELCDRIGIVNKGKLIKLDTPENLKSGINKGSIILIQVIQYDLKDIEYLKFNPHIQNVYVEEVDNNFIIKITTESPWKIFSDITSYLNKNGILNITTKDVTLEDVYIQLINK